MPPDKTPGAFIPPKDDPALCFLPPNNLPKPKLTAEPTACPATAAPILGIARLRCVKNRPRLPWPKVVDDRPGPPHDAVAAYLRPELLITDVHNSNSKPVIAKEIGKFHRAFEFVPSRCPGEPCDMRPEAHRVVIGFFPANDQRAWHSV